LCYNLSKLLWRYLVGEWNSVFGEFTVEPTNATIGAYSLTSTNPFIMNWSWNGTQNVVCTYTNLSASIAGTNIQLPSVLNASIGWNFQFKNTGTQSIAINTYTGANIFNLGVGNIANIIVVSTINDNAASWQYNQLNVTVQTVASASAVAGPGLSVTSGLLFPQQQVVTLDLSATTPSAPYLLNSIDPNTTYVIRPNGGYILLPDAGTSDIGSQITFKNSANGSVVILTNTINTYYIDINTTNFGPSVPYGNAQVVIAPNESVLIEYTGPVDFPITSMQYLMYYTVAKVNQPSNLLAQTTIDLPALPPVGSITLGATVVMTDVINFYDSTGIATGTYNYIVPYPVNKIYYVALISSQPSSTFPTVILNFASGGLGHQLILNYTQQSAIIYVALDGQVVVFGASGSGGGGSGTIPAYTLVGNNTSSVAPAAPHSTADYQGSIAAPAMLFPCFSCADLQNAVYNITNYPDGAGTPTIFGRQRGYTDGNGNPVQNMYITNGTESAEFLQEYDATGAFPNNKITASTNVNISAEATIGYDINNNPYTSFLTTSVAGEYASIVTNYGDGGDAVLKPQYNLTNTLGSNTYSTSISSAVNGVANNYNGFYTQVYSQIDNATFNVIEQYPDVNNNMYSSWYSAISSTATTGIKLYNDDVNWMMPEIIGDVATLGNTAQSIATYSGFKSTQFVSGDWIIQVAGSAFFPVDPAFTGLYISGTLNNANIVNGGGSFDLDLVALGVLSGPITGTRAGSASIVSGYSVSSTIGISCSMSSSNFLSINKANLGATVTSAITFAIVV